MTASEVKQITRSLGHKTIARARAQFEADLALLYQVFDLTDYMNDWEDAIAENDYRDTLAAIRLMIAAVTATAIR